MSTAMLTRKVHIRWYCDGNGTKSGSARPLLCMDAGACFLQEAEKFLNHFQDPEFRQLFEDYAKEISDPKVQERITGRLTQVQQCYGLHRSPILLLKDTISAKHTVTDQLECVLTQYCA